MRSSRGFETLALFAAVAAPLLPDPWALVVLALACLAWLLLRPAPRELVVPGLALAAAVACLAFSSTESTGSAVLPGPEELTESYRRLWLDLDGEAREARRELVEILGEIGDGEPREDARRRAFQVLTDRESAAAPARGAVFLVDMDGRPWAWAGEGLLHELQASEVPREGREIRASFGAVTLMVVLPVGEAARPWRVVAARSYPADRLPFQVDGRTVERPWSLVEREFEAAPEAFTVSLPELPILVLAPPGEAVPGPTVAARRLTGHRLAWVFVALALVALAVVRLVSMALAEEQERRPAGVGGLMLAAAAALGLAAGLDLLPLTVLVAGVGLAVVGLDAAPWEAMPRRRLPALPFEPRADRPTGLLWGMSAAVVPGLLAWFLLRRELTDLAGDLSLQPVAAALRVGVFGIVLGLMALAAASGEGAPRGGDRWIWGALALLLAGGAFHDLPFLSIPLLLGGAALAGLWLQGRPILRRAGILAAVVCVAALVAAGSWETVYRMEVRRQLEEEALPGMHPPSPQEVQRLNRLLNGYFANVELGDLAPREPAGLEVQDLAFLLWKRSPLARSDALSFLSVEAPSGERSVFSFGLEADDPTAAGGLPVWRDRHLRGEAWLRYQGRNWGRARWGLALQPGFRLAGDRRLREVEAGLLAGLPEPERRMDALPGPALFALYAADGRVLRSPWDEEQALPAGLAAQGPAVVETPDGPAWAYVRRGTDGWEVLYLPRLNGWAGLERVSTHAVALLLILGALALLAAGLALPRPRFRRLLTRTYRSYSKRLIIVTTSLVLLPLLAVNVLVVTAAEERFGREQRAAGEAALLTLQEMVERYVLDELEFGVRVDPASTNEFLEWLSRTLRREVNLYWQNEIFSSSKAELFTAGVLPKRIPGEVYARLALAGEDVEARTNRVGETTYLELYTPLELEGWGDVPIIVSMPLLAQEAEVARELAALRRQALLVTIFLFALLIAVGLRLARSFTEPLLELIEGTRRIAAGAPALEVSPNELELASLARAIDEMARRVAESRQRLVREKQVVERIVDTITSGVVSLDHQGRVMMRNRVAAELLGVEVGQSLADGAGDLPAPVAALLEKAGAEPLRRTVRLPGDADREPRDWSLAWVPVPGSGEPAALLVVEDVSEVLRGQRLEAWAEMARIIAHEIKNPLTPIRLNAEHVRQVWASDRDHFEQVFERCMGNILGQVAELQEIASEFSTYSSILRIERKPDDLVEAMEELVEPYRTAPPQGVRVALEADAGPLPARFDRRLLSRAVRNLLENALRATSAAGGEVRLEVQAADGQGRIAVLDEGPGVAPELLSRIFDPYFSTHDSGTGLGLPIARRVVEEHGGAIAARNRPGGGLEVSISLPLG